MENVSSETEAIRSSTVFLFCFFPQPPYSWGHLLLSHKLLNLGNPTWACEAVSLWACEAMSLWACEGAASQCCRVCLACSISKVKPQVLPGHLPPKIEGEGPAHPTRSRRRTRHTPETHTHPPTPGCPYAS